MPRNGSGVYSAPAGTLGTPNTVIESAKYNAFVNDLVSDANAARPVSAGGTGGTSQTTAQSGLGVDGKVVYVTKSAGYTAVAADNNAYFRFTAGATLALTAAATLGANWHCTIQANGGAVVIDPNGAETVNGASTVTIADGQSALLICTGSAFFAVIVPGLAAANTWGGNQTYSSGINFGATTVVSVTDLSKHINLYNNQYGFSITGGSFNYISGLAHNFYAASTLVATISSVGNFTPTGDVTLASNKTITFSGTGAATTRANLQVVVKRSGQLTPSLGGTLTYAHGLSYTPDVYWAEMECTTADGGWSVGDIIRGHVDDNGGGYGVEVYRDATNVYGIVGANGIGQTHNKSTGASVTLTTASWRVRLCAR